VSCLACARIGPRSAPPAACQHLPLSETLFAAARLRTSQAPSIGFLKDLPSIGIPAGVHSRGLAPASARSPPGTVLVPSSPFLPASTASSSIRFAGLLRPASDPGVHRVSMPRCRMPATISALPHRCLPSRAFPSREAVPTSPWFLAPLSLRGLRRCDYEALFRSGIRCDKGSWPNPHRPLLSWASPPGAPPERAVHRPLQAGTSGATWPAQAQGRSGGWVRAIDATAARRQRPHRCAGKERQVDITVVPGAVES